MSPSSRRAWIEISLLCHKHSRSAVALLAEGVDRNGNLMVVNEKVAGRPPRGGRG